MDELGEKVAMCGKFWGEGGHVQVLCRIWGRVNAMGREGFEQQLKA